MKQPIFSRKPAAIGYGCFLALQCLFYLQTPFQSRFDVGGKWEAPLAYSLLFACLAWLWFRNLRRTRTDWAASRQVPWILGIAGLMQGFPIYFWWTFDRITFYVGAAATQPAMVCVAAHALFAVYTLMLLLRRKT